MSLSTGLSFQLTWSIFFIWVNYLFQSSIMLPSVQWPLFRRILMNFPRIQAVWPVPLLSVWRCQLQLRSISWFWCTNRSIRTISVFQNSKWRYPDIGDFQLTWILTNTYKYLLYLQYVPKHTSTLSASTSRHKSSQAPINTHQYVQYVPTYANAY